MKTSIASVAIVLAAFCCMLFAADGTESAGGDAGKEVTKNPSLLISPGVKVGELSVYGVKLGDPVDKIPGSAGLTKQGVPQRPDDAVYIGRDVCFYAFQGKIYRIKVLGDLARQIPPYDADRLQMALGKADQIDAPSSAGETNVSFFGRRLRYAVHDFEILSVVTEVDMYMP
jgi:hypothetical protein